LLALRLHLLGSRTAHALRAFSSGACLGWASEGMFKRQVVPTTAPPSPGAAPGPFASGKAVSERGEARGKVGCRAGAWRTPGARGLDQARIEGGAGNYPCATRAGSRVRFFSGCAWRGRTRANPPQPRETDASASCVPSLHSLGHGFREILDQPGERNLQSAARVTGLGGPEEMAWVPALRKADISYSLGRSGGSRRQRLIGPPFLAGRPESCKAEP
jgi:hypothetical protein